MNRKIDSILQGSMTVEQLIDALKDCDPNSRVVFKSDYGDRTHTMQALTVTNVEEVDATRIDQTAYSNSGLQVLDEGDSSDFDEDADPDYQYQVVILA